VGAATAFCQDDSQLSDGDCLLFVSNVAPAEPYPGPFTNMPAGPSAGLFDVPDIVAATAPSSYTPDPVQISDGPILAITGASSDALLIAGLSLLSTGALCAALARRRDEATN